MSVPLSADAARTAVCGPRAGIARFLDPSAVGVLACPSGRHSQPPIRPWDLPDRFSGALPMISSRRISRATFAFALCLAPIQLLAQTKATVAQWVSPPFSLQLVAAKNAERVAWIAYDR